MHEEGGGGRGNVFVFFFVFEANMPNYGGITIYLYWLVWIAIFNVGTRRIPCLVCLLSRCSLVLTCVDCLEIEGEQVYSYPRTMRDGEQGLVPRRKTPVFPPGTRLQSTQPAAFETLTDHNLLDKS